MLANYVAMSTRTVSCCFTVYLVTTSPVTPAIYSIKFLVFHFLGANFLTPNSGHCRENQSVLRNAEREKVNEWPHHWKSRATFKYFDEFLKKAISWSKISINERLHAQWKASCSINERLHIISYLLLICSILHPVGNRSNKTKITKK